MFQANTLTSLPRPPNDMVTIFLSEYFLNTAGNLLLKSGILKYTLSTKDIPQLKEVLAPSV